MTQGDKFRDQILIAMKIDMSENAEMLKMFQVMAIITKFQFAVLWYQQVSNFTIRHQFQAKKGVWKVCRRKPFLSYYHKCKAPEVHETLLLRSD